MVAGLDRTGDGNPVGDSGATTGVVTNGNTVTAMAMDGPTPMAAEDTAMAIRGIIPIALLLYSDHLRPRLAPLHRQLTNEQNA